MGLSSPKASAASERVLGCWKPRRLGPASAAARTCPCAPTLFVSAPTSSTNVRATSTTRHRKPSASRCETLPGLLADYFHQTVLLFRVARYIALRYTKPCPQMSGERERIVPDENQKTSPYV